MKKSYHSSADPTAAASMTWRSVFGDTARAVWLIVARSAPPNSRGRNTARRPVSKSPVVSPLHETVLAHHSIQANLSTSTGLFKTLNLPRVLIPTPTRVIRSMSAFQQLVRLYRGCGRQHHGDHGDAVT